METINPTLSPQSSHETSNGLVPSPHLVPLHAGGLQGGGGRIKDGGRPSANGQSPNSIPLSPRGGERDGDRGRISTGPKSLVGKARSRMNGVTHGLDATEDIFMASLNPREQIAFRKIRRSLRRFYNCATTSYERLLIDRMAVQHLRMLRLYRLESISMDFLPINKGSDRSIFPHLDRLSRYDVRIERQLRILHNRLLSVFNQNASNSFKPLSPQE